MGYWHHGTPPPIPRSPTSIVDVRDEDDAPEVQDSNRVTVVEGATVVVVVVVGGVDGEVRGSVGVDGPRSNWALNEMPVVDGGCDLLQLSEKTLQSLLLPKSSRGFQQKVNGH